METGVLTVLVDVRIWIGNTKLRKLPKKKIPYSDTLGGWSLGDS